MADPLLVECRTNCPPSAEELDVEGVSSESQSSGGDGKEVYYLANFKAVMENCLLPSNPECHVISADETNMVGRFTKLSGT